MSETPQETAARADRVMAKCHERGQASLADVENLKNAVLGLAEECRRLGAAGPAPSSDDEWAVVRHWRRSTEYSRPMSEDSARALLAEDRANGMTSSLARRTPAPWRPVENVCGLVLAVGDDNEICVLPPHGDDVSHQHDPFAGTEGDDHCCDNCLGIDPDACLFNGERES